MSKRVTTADFIQRARKVHGNRYDYSNTTFVNSKTKLTIRCPSHGAWSQLPGNHLAGKGCRTCTGLDRLSTAEFVRRSREVHGTKYDYSKSEYINQKTRVRIICPIHGEFLQLPSEHYYAGSGCNRCASEARGLSRRLTSEEFIQRAKAVHGDRYDYSQSSYQDNFAKVTIICPDHGPFQQVPKNHIRGRGCPLCGGCEQLTTAQFVERSEEVHGDRYDYSLVKYVNTKAVVSIVCSEHGVFSQRPADHLSGHGCQICAAILGGQKNRLTKDEFIERAEAIHGDQYDYSLVEYLNSETKVTIVCPNHGRFLQTPGNHLAGRGCVDCATERRTHTAETFIQKANEVHGDRYDYSLVEYVNVSTNVTIICLDHGPFQQTPASHVYGESGCAECSGMAPLTTEKFIEKAKAVHGERYDYSQVKCQGNKADVIIICREHGPFRQLPTNHYRGKGCPDCGGSKQHTTQSFIEAVQAVHGDRYDYSQVEYVMNKAYITIICPDHGAFSQLAAAHLRGSGCPDCGGNKRHTTKSFIEAAKAIHGDLYDYSQVEYVGAHADVIINCPDHGPFLQAPTNHMGGNGCPSCAVPGFDPNEPGKLYYLAITTDEGDTLYKIGITNRTVEARFVGPDLARIRIVKIWNFPIGRTAKERESEILQQFKADQYIGPDMLVAAGNTQLFTRDVLELDKGDHELGQSAVDSEANLISRPIQRDFGFRKT